MINGFAFFLFFFMSFMSFIVGVIFLIVLANAAIIIAIVSKSKNIPPLCFLHNRWNIFFNN